MESYRTKIKTLEETRQTCAALKASGKRVVFTNGCFDLLHPGHIRYLSTAREQGDHLVVAVNSDRSVRSIKDPGRPICDEQVRAEMLASLSFVDSVLVFDEDTPLKVIESLVPDVLVKGGDWQEHEIVGSSSVKSSGGVVKRIPFEAGFSTTDIIQKILKAYS